MKKGLKFYAVTPNRWPDLEMLFGERGACGGCWCMYWRLPKTKWERGKKTGQNKKAMRKLVNSGKRPGIIAYDGKKPVAWCSIAPRDDFEVLERSRVLKRIDDKPVWSISCLFIAKEYRRQGLSTELIKKACDFAKKKRANIIEGYPFEVKKQQPDPFVWTGTPKSYLKAGFKVAARHSRSRPIMRLEV